MMNSNRKEKQKQINMVCIEDLVPQDHILRDIDKAIDFSFIYDEVRELYSAGTGRPSIDPVVLFKIVLIQYTFGIRSMRQTIKEIEVNNAYRWFLGYDLMEPIPHFSTFGKNYSRRFANTDIFEKIFAHILEEAVKAGFVDASAVFIDATHIKANANNKKYVNEAVKLEAKNYQKELTEEINKDRAEHGKKPLKDNEQDENDNNGDNSANDDNDDSSTPGASGSGTKNVKKSTTDPECGLFHKGEHKVQFAYTAHTVCDKHNFILGAQVAPGNVHDSVMFDGLYKQVLNSFPEIEMVGIDCGYKTPWIMKQIFDSGRKPATPYKRPLTKRGYFKKYDYVYDEYFDQYICPNNKLLDYSTTNRDGYREYKSHTEDCRNCPYREQCTQSKTYQKVITRHVWEDYMELAEDVRHSPQGKEIYKLRCETIERIFADAKEKHAMRFTQLRGLARLKMQVLLTFSCMNLMKLARWKKKTDLFPELSAAFCSSIVNLLEVFKNMLEIFEFVKTKAIAV